MADREDFTDLLHNATRGGDIPLGVGLGREISVAYADVLAIEPPLPPEDYTLDQAAEDVYQKPYKKVAKGILGRRHRNRLADEVEIVNDRNWVEFYQASLYWSETVQDSIGVMLGVSTLLGDRPSFDQLQADAVRVRFNPERYGFEYAAALCMQGGLPKEDKERAQYILHAVFDGMPARFRRSSALLADSIVESENFTVMTGTDKEFVAEGGMVVASRILDIKFDRTHINRDTFRELVAAAKALAAAKNEGADIGHILEELGERLGGGDLPAPDSDFKSLNTTAIALRQILDESDFLKKLYAHRYYGYDDYFRVSDFSPRKKWMEEVDDIAPAEGPVEYTLEEWHGLDGISKIEYFNYLQVTGQVEKMEVYASTFPEHFRLHGYFVVLASLKLKGKPIPEEQLAIRPISEIVELAELFHQITESETGKEVTAALRHDEALIELLQQEVGEVREEAATEIARRVVHDTRYTVEARTDLLRRIIELSGSNFPQLKT